jgi:hypothetical protein
MHDQPSPAVEDDRTDFAVLMLLLEDGVPRPWAVEEVAREIGDSMAVDDTLSRLHGAGLVHRLDGFVFATRAAQQSVRLALR